MTNAACYLKITTFTSCTIRNSLKILCIDIETTCRTLTVFHNSKISIISLEIHDVMSHENWIPMKITQVTLHRNRPSYFIM